MPLMACRLTPTNNNTADGWAVGETNSGSLFTHLTSGSFSQLSVSPSSSIRLTGVSERSSSDVWAVGENGTHTYAIHYDGSSWSIPNNNNPPNPGNNENQLTSVKIIGASDVWAVGYSDSPTGFLTHWNGSSWSSATNVSVGSYSVLEAVSAVDSNNIWAAGYYSGGMLIWHSTNGGSSWHQATTESAGSNPLFTAITIDSASGNTWAVGASTSSGFQQTLIEFLTG